MTVNGQAMPEQEEHQEELQKGKWLQKVVPYSAIPGDWKAIVSPSEDVQPRNVVRCFLLYGTEESGMHPEAATSVSWPSTLDSDEQSEKKCKGSRILLPRLLDGFGTAQETSASVEELGQAPCMKCQWHLCIQLQGMRVAFWR